MIVVADLLLLIGVAAIGTLAFAAWSIARVVSARRHGRLVVADTHVGPPLRSTRYHLVGRPDEMRRLSDGRPVPIELKSRTAPSWGPARSHVVQVLAYCLLLEDVTGLSPPYGVLRYSDGSEFRVRWDASARREILELRQQIEAVYDGRATPSPGRCRHCRWFESCDARAV